MQTSFFSISSNGSFPYLKQQVIHRTGADTNPIRRHLALNPEAFAPTPPEYLAPWLFFGKPNNQSTATTGTMGTGSEATPLPTPPVPTVVPESSVPVGTTTTPIQPPTNIPHAAEPPVVDDTPSASADAPASAAAATTPEADSKVELPQEKDKPLIIRGFDNSVIRNLNRRLEDPDWQKRAEASNDFSMILGANPNLERRPAYKPYIDAFMLKILRDTSAVVHEPALRSIQVGYYRHPTAAVIEELNVLKTGIGLFGLEPQMVTDALYSLHSYQQQEAEETKQATQRKQAQKTKPQDPAVPQTQLIS